MEAKTLDTKDVAAVCDNEVLIFGGQTSNGRRPLKDRQTFAHHGAALAYAVAFDDSQRKLK